MGQKARVSSEIFEGNYDNWRIKMFKTLQIKLHYNYEWRWNRVFEEDEEWEEGEDEEWEEEEW